MMSVLSVDELKSKYNFQISDAYRGMYENYIQMATEACFRVIGLSPDGTVECIDYFDSGITNFALYSGPVTEVTSLEIWNGSEWIKADLTSAIVQLPAGIVTVRGSLPALGNKAIKITYKAGYKEYPADLKMCIAMTVQHLAKQINSNMVGVTSRNVEGGTESIDANIPPLSVQNHLQRLRIGGRAR
jgi:hypothetical protein